jgi:hypothetical protein
MLHTFHDGSTLHKSSAQELLKIPIWKGKKNHLRFVELKFDPG